MTARLVHHDAGHPSEHPLVTAGCTCGISPRAACIACARWQRHYRSLLARRQASDQHQRPAAPPAPREGG